MAGTTFKQNQTTVISVPTRLIESGEYQGNKYGLTSHYNALSNLLKLRKSLVTYTTYGYAAGGRTIELNIEGALTKRQQKAVDEAKADGFVLSVDHL